jgi:hypothetical protein
VRERFERKYKIKMKGCDVVIEERKQELQAKSQTPKRYTELENQYRQNRMFDNNQKQFYRDLQKLRIGRKLHLNRVLQKIFGRAYGARDQNTTKMHHGCREYGGK